MTTPFCHGTFTLNRTWKAAPERVFRAWSDPQVKAQWFTGPPETWTLIERSLDFTVGGTEVLHGRFKSGLETLFKARFHLIEPPYRLVYVYDLYHSGRFHSVTQSSLTLTPDGSGTHVAYTEQMVFIDGEDGTESRHHGTNLQYDLIERLVHSGA